MTDRVVAGRVAERVVVFGAHAGLVGVLSEPSAGASAPDTAVITSNIGMHHRVGPFRMYVDLSRKLAALGWPVLRFDLSGMGDSAQRNDAPTPGARAERDVADAMDYLGETMGVSKFILVGLCSGVDSTHAVASHDPRVIGAVFIDGYSYPTLGFKLRRYLLRPLQWHRWRRFVNRRLGENIATIVEQEGPAVFTREYPTREKFQQDVRAMTQRGVRLLFIYTGGVYARFNSARQFFEFLAPGTPRAGIEVETMYSADHVFASTVERNRLFGRITEWANTVRR